MRKSRPAAAALALAMVASCAPRAVPPAPTPPAPEPQRQPEPPAPPPPAPAAWEDSALTPGDWTYRSEGSASSASYGTFTIRCESGRQVTLSLAGAAGSALTVRTTYGDRSLAAQPRQGALVATLPASDALLDQMVFSRGRFAVEAPGTQRLILPAWAEPGRVVEDCRS